MTSDKAVVNKARQWLNEGLAGGPTGSLGGTKVRHYTVDRFTHSFKGFKAARARLGAEYGELIADLQTGTQSNVAITEGALWRSNSRGIVGIVGIVGETVRDGMQCLVCETFDLDTTRVLGLKDFILGFSAAVAGRALIHRLLLLKFARDVRRLNRGDYSSLLAAYSDNFVLHFNEGEHRWSGDWEGRAGMERFLQNFTAARIQGEIRTIATSGRAAASIPGTRVAAASFRASASAASMAHVP